MLKFIFIFLGGFACSLILTPFAKYLSRKLNFLDQPGHRKIHAKPVPLMGGVSIFLSLSLSLWIIGTITKEIFGILMVGAIFVLFGLLDDYGIKIRARYKIWSHLIFSFFLIYLTGIAFELFPFNSANWILTACYITFMTNSMNMLDGMDGLVSGVCFFSSLFFFILALNNNQYDLALISIATSGVTLGFLKYNFNPASIFLGEGGSTFLGFIMAVISLKMETLKLWDIALILKIPRLQVISFVVLLIILGIPIFDTFFVFINRFFHHIKFSTPGMDHSHHRIHLMGLSQRATVFSIYCVQIILGSIALAMVNSDLQQFLCLFLIIGVLITFVCFFLTSVKVYSNDTK